MFEPYRKEDLISIVESRVGTSIVDPKLIEFAASKVAATSGDARRVLQLVAKAIDKCVDKLKPSQLEAEFEFSSDAMPIVKIPCVMAVIRENNDKFTNTIKDCCQMK